MGTDHREALHVGKPCLKMLAFVNASHKFLNLMDPSLSQACWVCLCEGQGTYSGVGTANQSLTNNTKWHV